jgi:anti-sigma factor RsiW
MTWKCEQVEARLSDYLDGLLQASELTEFEAHAGQCAQCAPLLASVRSMVVGMHAMEELETPPRLIYSILDQTLGKRETVSTWQSVLNFLGGFASPKFAYGGASVLATCVILISASGFSLRKPKLADLRPANMYRNADRQAHLAYARSVKYVSDLRVVYEIQSRLRSDQNDLQTTPDESLPKAAPEKNPGQTDDKKPAQPRQQNRANEVGHLIEVLAAQCPVIYERSLR